jgi:hypothetical protein
MTFFFAAMCMLISTQTGIARQEAPPAVSGRLATVEPGNRRITILPEGEVRTVEMFVTDKSAVVHEDRSITLSDLVLQVGRRITVHFRVVGNRRVAERIIVDPA